MLTRMRTVGASIAALVLLAAIGTTLVLAQSGSDAPSDTGPVDLDTIREDAVRNLFDSDGRMVNPEHQLAVIAKEHEGGFGGYYFDKTDKSTVYVYMKDVTKTTAAEAAFRAAYSSDRQVSRVIAVQGPDRKRHIACQGIDTRGRKPHPDRSLRCGPDRRRAPDNGDAGDSRRSRGH
ncbi:MAG: hypothetical protein J4G14_13485 [Dehalococcoidia bacterium]|nr:hypothetical protein [Dehalococcoidia bacterium]